MRLLMIDDDESLADIISRHLIQQHYAVDIATNGQMGLEFIDLFHYDLVILDLMLPDLDGRAICTRIRKNKHQMPILMLTARDKAEDKIESLNAGADDYIVKPIHLPELIARIRALLRRASVMTTPQLQWGPLQIDPNSFETTYNGQPMVLTPKEYSILELFLRNPSKSQTLDGIIDNIWALSSPPSLYAVRTHIKSVRHKLKTLGAPSDFIETLYGFGYRLNPQYHHATEIEAPASHSVDHPVEACPPPLPSQIETMTHELWSKHEDEMEDRIHTLETLVHAIQDHSVTDDLKQEGVQIAHKLAGSLGCFSFQEGSKLAKKLEQRLHHPSRFTSAQEKELQTLVQQLRDSLHLSPQTQSTKGDRRHLLAYSRHQPLLQSLQSEALDYGFTLTSVLDSNTFLKQLKMSSPDVILLDIDQPPQGLRLLSLLQDLTPNAPVMAIMRHGEWLDQCDYVQYGVRRVFHDPTAISRILEAAHQLDASTHMRAKILLVDDDQLLLSVLNRNLSALGFEMTTLENPHQFWTVLRRTKPDLVILDVEMPETSGLRLCQLLRADADWTHLPVIFLTSHQEPQTEDHAFMAGADDFISKSLPVDRLALRIQNRLRSAPC